MSCDYDYDYEEPEFFSARKHTARKKHMCSECCGDILPGEVYESIAGKWNGDLSSYKHCGKCLDLIYFMKAHIKCFQYAFTQLMQGVVDEIYGRGQEASALVFPAFRHVVRSNRNRKRLRNEQEMAQK